MNQEKKCIKCNSDRLISINAHCSDCFSANYRDIEYDGYVIDEIGLGNFCDDVDLTFCLDCGQIQHTFPISEQKVINRMRCKDDEEDE